MNEEIKVMADRHFVVPLTDEDAHQLKVKVAQSGLKQKDWLTEAIKEKLSKEEN